MLALEADAHASLTVKSETAGFAGVGDEPPLHHGFFCEVKFASLHAPFDCSGDRQTEACEPRSDLTPLGGQRVLRDFLNGVALGRHFLSATHTLSGGRPPDRGIS